MEHPAELPIPTTWNRAGLAAVGFLGFVPFVGQDPAAVPAEKGVYAVLRESTAPVELLEVNPARVGPGRQASYEVDHLLEQWVEGAAVVYIGKAETRRGLRQRLSQFRRLAASHSGGRSIWQLADSAELLICWQVTPDGGADAYETQLIGAFRDRYGRRPFANRVK